MFKEFIVKLKQLAERPPFDPSIFADPLATQTAWTPAKPGGSSFRTHGLTSISSYRLEFKATIGARLFGLSFLLIGPGFAGVMLFNAADSPTLFRPQLLVPLLIGAVCAIVGGGMIYSWTRPIVFDKHRGFFWVGRQEPHQTVGPSPVKIQTPLAQIHALQLVSEHCSTGNRNSYTSYELNLVLKDATRLNVADHGNIAKLREDARTLAGFLGVPVWDAT